MAKHSKEDLEIDQRIKNIRWLQWQSTRRNPDYQNDVEKLLTTTKKKAQSSLRISSKTPIDQTTDKEIISGIKQHAKRETYSDIVRVYYFVSALYRYFIDKGVLKLCKKTYLESWAKEEIFNCLRMEALPRSLRKKNKPFTEYLPKELKDFEKKWSIMFPIDPDIETFDDRDLFKNYDANPIIGHTLNKREKTLTVRVSLACQKEILMARLEGHIMGYKWRVAKSKTSCDTLIKYLNPDFNRGELSIKIRLSEPKGEILSLLNKGINTNKKQLQNRKLYQRYFAVFDLIEKIKAKRKELRKKEGYKRGFRDSNFDYIAKILHNKDILEGEELKRTINQAKKDYTIALRLIGITKQRNRVYQRETVQTSLGKDFVEKDQDNYDNFLDLLNISYNQSKGIRYDILEDAIIQKMDSDAEQIKK